MLGRRVVTTLALVIVCLVFFNGAALAVQSPSGDVQPAPSASPRLIVEFKAPPLAAVYKTQIHAASADGRLDVSSADAQAYVSELQSQQAAFAGAMTSVLPKATVSTFIDENGAAQPNTYQVVFNGMAIFPNNGDLDAARAVLAKMPNVKAVHLDGVHTTDLYTSTLLINAPAVWNQLGGRANAGAGVKFASMDGGVHHLSPMFNGAGYTYPNGFGPNGKGLTDNNNGKIITSRAYFRSWDPPLPDDAFAWPGPDGTPHGVHTASTAAGNVVTDVVYSGLPVGTMSGVAPRAYVMSYKVFYGSVTGDASFYDAEGIAALEDIAADGANVLNNSWGNGPYSVGGPADPLDTALINTANAGVFISLSAGNAGPYESTLDHPSPEYITVAASTSGGNFGEGTVTITESATLKDMPFGTGEWGPGLTPGETYDYDFVPAAAVAPANVEGCAAFPANTFAGKAALIQRGTCVFSDKAWNAQQAGATFVIVYNNRGGDVIQGMSCSSHCADITINGIFISQNSGNGMVQFYTDEGAAKSHAVVSSVAFQLGGRADLITDFSSRGPGVGNVLKPDIAAPGFNILAQGYTPGAQGEDTYFGYGQAAGTSMASPHVAGAAALVRAAYPSWPNLAIKSALMSTSKYLDVYNQDAELTPAQPLDMGAGRLDLTHVLDPGVILNPPSVSFGRVMTGTTETLVVQVTNITTVTESYALSTLYTGAGFTQTTALPGFSLNTLTLTLAPGETKPVSVTLDPAASQGIGDNQGYIVLDGPVHDAHMPVWARITPGLSAADVLILDDDASDFGFPDYLGVYTSTLDAIGKTYAVVNVSDGYLQATTIPNPAQLAAYGVVLLYTGDNYVPELGLTTQDQYWLNDYLNSGGTMVAMGQDLAGTLAVPGATSTNWLYNAGLASNWVQDSISDGGVPTGFATTAPTAPPVLNGVVLKLIQPYIDELYPADLGYGRGGIPVFNYNGPFNLRNGTVAMAHRDQPSLELPDLAFYGRAFYAAFGLEGMLVTEYAPGQSTVSPPVLLNAALTWAASEPGTATISDTTPVSATAMTLFQAAYTAETPVTRDPAATIAAISFGWDFGDGSPYLYTDIPQAGHTYQCAANNVYTVRVEVMDELGNVTIGSQQVDVSNSCSTTPVTITKLWLPTVSKN